MYNADIREKYDIISTICEWDDVTLQSNLFRKGKSYLNDCMMSENIKVSAADLSLTDEKIEEFQLGWVKFESSAHDIDEELILSEIEIPLLDPLSTIFTIGKTRDTLTEKTVKSQKEFENKVLQVSGMLYDSITRATEMILGSKGGYKLTEMDENGRWLRDLYMDAPDKSQAKNIMQISMGGIGFSNNGYNGPYKSAWTIDGHFLADWITAGTMQADRIRGGILQSNNYVAGSKGVQIDLDKGKIDGPITADCIKSGTMQAERIRGGVLQSNNYAAGSSGMKIDMDNGRIDTNYLNLGNYMRYDAGSSEPMIIGGWQIRKIDGAEYWDTVGTQENGIGAYGPWVVWGGWNGQAPFNVDNYNFVVLQNGICKATEFLNGSRKEWKKNIQKYDTDALSKIRNTDVCRYNLKERKTDKEHIGFIIGDGYNVPDELLSESGGAVDLYKAIAVAYKAIQELADMVDKKGGKK